ncbi:AI-2E family transporter [Pseudothermotoga thermarum]|uniref:AI-2E family transporter n=1 Tax=Pseudothermotoga thermarum DSM 5069 TaxID=688269 RepID=F7YU54_9THEM|nr:AI-2E family transporter [Pseudothermotoga thermarum]AEH50150.1 protein of unknown function UPF0118 [Pseudothermotoga thermarum DSM 5069]
MKGKRLGLYFTLLYSAIFLIIGVIFRNFFNAFLLTFIGTMIVDGLANIIQRFTKLPKLPAKIVALTLYFGVILWGLIMLIPKAFIEFSGFYELIANTIESRAWEDYIKGNEALLKMLNDIVDFLKPSFSELLNYVVKTLARQFPDMLVVAFFSILGTVYASIYLENLIAVIPYLYPKGCRKDVTEFVEELMRNTRRFISVIALNAMIIGVSFAVFFSIMKLPYAPLLAFWGFVTNFIPIVGTVFEIIPVLIFSLSLGLGKIFWIVVFLVIIHTFVFVLFFELMKGYTRLNPVLLIFSILLAGQVFGMVGTFFGAPAALFATVFFDKFVAPEFERE